MRFAGRNIEFYESFDEIYETSKSEAKQPENTLPKYENIGNSRKF